MRHADELLHHRYVQANHQIMGILEHSKINFEGLIEDAPSLVAVIDASGRIMKANQRAYQLLGCSADEASTLNLLDIFKPETRTKFQERGLCRVRIENHRRTR